MPARRPQPEVRCGRSRRPVVVEAAGQRGTVSRNRLRRARAERRRARRSGRAGHASPARPVESRFASASRPGWLVVQLVVVVDGAPGNGCRSWWSRVLE